MLAVTNLHLSFHFLPDFGKYVHTREDGDNYMEARTLGDLSLHSTGNSQGGNYFLNLQTEHLVMRYPMPSTYKTTPSPT